MTNTTPSTRFVNPPTMPEPSGYTHVVETHAGRTVYISGQIAFDAHGNLVGAGDVQAQTAQVFRNLQAALVSVDADFAHVVKLTFFLRDMNQIAIVRQVRDTFINVNQPPASSTVEVCRLVRDDLLLEVDAIAVVPE